MVASASGVEDIGWVRPLLLFAVCLSMSIAVFMAYFKYPAASHPRGHTAWRPQGPTRPHPATLATTIRRWGRQARV